MSDTKFCVLDTKAVSVFVDAKWDDEIIPEISDYIKIPNQSPLYDNEIHTNGFQEQAVDLMVNWAKKQGIEGMELKVVHEEGKTPLIFAVIEGANSTQETVLMYGHFDKQPPMEDKWDEGLGPWSPVIKDNRLFGRGGADDGYAIFASLTAVKALQEQKVPASRVVIMIEGSEESGSPDLPFYVELLKKEIGNPSLVVCLDSGCGNYDQLWLTSSLRGMVAGNLRVNILTEGVHSGAASGIVPSSFRILRMLLDRIEDAKTGEVTVPAGIVDIPEVQQAYIKSSALSIGDMVHAQFPFVDGATPISDDLVDLVTQNTWRSTVSVTGFEGAPGLAEAGNVLRTDTSVKLSIRLPPTVDPKVFTAALKEILEANPPYGAKVEFEAEKGAKGWMAPILSPWLTDSCNASSTAFFGKPMSGFGEGGTIPLMGMLSRLFPSTQFLITGVLGPKSNAHGPNEFLDINMGKQLTKCCAKILGDHYANL